MNFKVRTFVLAIEISPLLNLMDAYNFSKTNSTLVVYDKEIGETIPFN